MAFNCAICGYEDEEEIYVIPGGELICEDCAYQVANLLSNATGRNMRTAVKYLRAYCCQTDSEQARDYLKFILAKADI